MNEIKVSVIMPVYNSELYLEQCLDSLLNQSFTDFEIICVNDGSTDSSETILDQYRQKDNRVVPVYQENSGAAVARNHGFSLAKGKYVMFLDADDFFEPDLLAHTYAKAKDSGYVDIVIFDGRKYNDTTKVFSPDNQFLRKDLLPYPDKTVFSRSDIPDTITRIVNPAPWTRLYRAGFIRDNNLEYQNLPNSNDYYFGLITLICANSITCVYETLVNYRFNNQSSTQGQREKNCLCFAYAIEKVYDELVSRGLYDEVRNSFVNTAVGTAVNMLRTAVNSGTRSKILDHLFSPEFERTGVIRDDIRYYSEMFFYRHARSIINANNLRKSIQKAEKIPTVETVVQANMSSVPKVSVIVPVYNVENYLSACLDSLVSQTLDGIEIICVNDGTPDDSEAILLEYAGNHDNISVYRQENNGLSAARNTGIGCAAGEYIYFMDSDDILESDALESLYEKAKSADLDVVYFDADVFYDTDDRSLQFDYDRKTEFSDVYTGPDLLYRMRSKGVYYATACLYLIKRSLISENHMQFHRGILHEDNPFTFELALRAERVSHIHRPFFHRRVRSNSIMSGNIGFKHSYGYFIAYLDMMQTLDELKEKLNEDELYASVNAAAAVLASARRDYAPLPADEKASELGCGELYPLFNELVKKPAESVGNKAARPVVAQAPKKTAFSFKNGENVYNIELRKSGAENEENVSFVVDKDGERFFHHIINPDGSKNWVDRKELLELLAEPVEKVDFELIDQDNRTKVELRRSGDEGDQSVSFVVDDGERKQFHHLINSDGSKAWVDEKEFRSELSKPISKLLFDLKSEENDTSVELRKAGAVGKQSIAFVVGNDENKQFHYLINPDGSRAWVDEKEFRSEIAKPVNRVLFDLQSDESDTAVELRRAGAVGKQSVAFVVGDGDDKQFHYLINPDGSKAWVDEKEFMQFVKTPVSKLAFALNTDDRPTGIELRKAGASGNESIAFVVNDGEHRLFHHMINADGTRNWTTPNEFTAKSKQFDDKLSKQQDKISKQQASLIKQQDSLNNQQDKLKKQAERIKALEKELKGAQSKVESDCEQIAQLNNLWLVRAARKFSRIIHKLLRR